MNQPATQITAAQSPFQAKYGNFIGGDWAEPVAGRYFDNISPITGSDEGRSQRICCRGSSADMDDEKGLSEQPEVLGAPRANARKHRANL